MSLETEIPGYSFALLASGANFSCEVLQALLQCHYSPKLLILPEYPPAQSSPVPDNEIISSAPERRLLEQAQGIDIGYAPKLEQQKCANLIRQYAIEFLLVACWPYLIDRPLIESAAKATLNMHPSLLPDYRGPNPIEQQLKGQESRFGVTLHLLNQHFDQGDIIAQAELTDVDENPDRLYLEHCNAVLGAGLFIEAVKEYDRGWTPIRQPAYPSATD